MVSFTRRAPVSLRPYLIAVGSILVALLARQLLDPILGDRVPFGTFFIAVMITAWWTDVKATLVALALGSIAGIYFYVPPRNVLWFASIADALGWAIFFAVGLVSAVISQANRNAQRQAQTAIQQLEQEVKKHQGTLAAFHDKDAEFRNAIENGATPMHWVDQAGHIIWANQAELDFLGYAREDYVGHPVTEFHTDPAAITDVLQRLTRNEIVPSYEAHLHHKDGSLRHVMMNSGIYYQNGQLPHIRFFSQDITQRKAADEIRARLSAIVAYSDDAIVSKTLQGIVVSWNAGAQRIFGYTEAEMAGKSIRVLIPPERMHEEDEFLRRLSNGEHIDHFETVRVRKDGQRINISVTLSPIKDAAGAIIGASKIAQDITNRKREEQRNTMLLDLSSAFSQALTPNQIAEVMVEHALSALGATVGVVSLLVEQGATLEIINTHSAPAHIFDRYRRTPLSLSAPVNDAIRTSQMVWIETRADLIRRYPHLEKTVQQSGTHAAIAVPLQVDEKIIGGMVFSFPVEKAPNRDEESFFTTLAFLCAQSLERARLYVSERQERALAEALRDTVVALSNTWELSEILDQILDNIDPVVQHDVADIMLIQEGIARVARSHRYAEHGMVKSERDMREFTLKVSNTPYLQWISEHKRPMVIEDTASDPDWVILHEPILIRSSIMVPILIDNEVSGFLNVNSLTPNRYSAQDGDRMQGFADQAAVAIRNAQLYQRALDTAALEERQRIARDLHDAVSQTLFSANLIAESLPLMWERQPSKTLNQIQNLHQLTRAAAAEMRVLLVELRPETLTTIPLSDLLTQLGYSLPGRTSLDLSLIVRGTNKQLFPPEVQIALYRIAQESLNNTIKHGGANCVRIRLFQSENRAALVITDNGRGFDTRRSTGGIGLKSMRERANSINAELVLKSKPGRGTQVKITWWQPEIEGDSG